MIRFWRRSHREPVMWLRTIDGWMRIPWDIAVKLADAGAMYVDNDGQWFTIEGTPHRVHVLPAGVAPRGI